MSTPAATQSPAEPQPVTLPSVERLRAALADVEQEIDSHDPESTKYLRGVRDTLRALLGETDGDDSAADLFILLDDPDNQP